jgi:hypothetical protein
MRALAPSMVLALGALCAHAEDKVNVIMPWTAEAEQGGLYQAPIFQKEPSVLIAHPEAGLKTMADMKGKPIAVSQSVLVTWWR